MVTVGTGAEALVEVSMVTATMFRVSQLATGFWNLPENEMIKQSTYLVHPLSLLESCPELESLMDDLYPFLLLQLSVPGSHLDQKTGISSVDARLETPIRLVEKAARCEPTHMHNSALVLVSRQQIADSSLLIIGHTICRSTCRIGMAWAGTVNGVVDSSDRICHGEPKRAGIVGRRGPVEK